jgi:hypothetical protein
MSAIYDTDDGRGYSSFSQAFADPFESLCLETLARHVFHLAIFDPPKTT